MQKSGINPTQTWRNSVEKSEIHRASGDAKIINSENEAILHELYTNPANPSSYGSIKDLYQYAKKKIPNLTLNQVKNFLEKSHTYTSYKSRRYKFPRRRIEYNKDTWAIDLLDFSKFASSNSNYKWLLLVVETDTRFAYGRCLKSKKAYEVGDAFDSIVQQNDGVSPYFVWADQVSREVTLCHLYVSLVYH